MPIALGNEGVDWDAEREEITTIVLHHTKNPSGVTLDRLNAMHLIRLYAARYTSTEEEPDLRGQPIWSNLPATGPAGLLGLSLAGSPRWQTGATVAGQKYRLACR